MFTPSRCVAVVGALLLASACLQAASIDSNLVYETPRIASGDQLVSGVISDCFSTDTMACLRSKVLNYLDTQLGVNEEYGRSFESDNKIDEVIFDRAARVLQQQTFRVQLPATVFDKAVLSYTPEAGVDITPAAEEGRGHLLKKKVLLPILLLLKLKMKALMPIVVGLIGLKAMKALILSKLAISLVLGFVVYQLITKKSAAMPMMPMTESPLTAYGPPTSSSASAAQSSYDSSAWDTSSSGGPYARVWEPSTSASGQTLAYSSYYPSSSSSSSGSSSTGSSSSVVSGSTSGSSGSSY